MKKRLQADEIAKQDLDIKEKIRLMKEQIEMYKGAEGMRDELSETQEDVDQQNSDYQPVDIYVQEQSSIQDHDHIIMKFNPKNFKNPKSSNEVETYSSDNDDPRNYIELNSVQMAQVPAHHLRHNAMGMSEPAEEVKADGNSKAPKRIGSRHMLG